MPLLVMDILLAKQMHVKALNGRESPMHLEAEQFPRAHRRPEYASVEILRDLITRGAGFGLGVLTSAVSHVDHCAIRPLLHVLVQIFHAADRTDNL
jgi:hypothetical protein